MRKKRKLVTFRMREALLNKLDAVAKRHQRTKVEIVDRALVLYLRSLEDKWREKGD